MKTDVQITIDNLRQLADHAEAYAEQYESWRFNMGVFKGVFIRENGVVLDSEFSRSKEVPEEYECKTSCLSLIHI